jgi:hypothetical protein
MRITFWSAALPIGAGSFVVIAHLSPAGRDFGVMPRCVDEVAPVGYLVAVVAISAAHPENIDLFPDRGKLDHIGPTADTLGWRLPLPQDMGSPEGLTSSDFSVPAGVSI